jgi:hypothetical protein
MWETVAINPKTGFVFGCTKPTLERAEADFFTLQRALSCTSQDAQGLEARGSNALMRVAHFGTRFELACRASRLLRILAAGRATGVMSWKELKRMGALPSSSIDTSAYLLLHKFSLRADFLVPLREDHVEESQQL